MFGDIEYNTYGQTYNNPAQTLAKPGVWVNRNSLYSIMINNTVVSSQLGFFMTLTYLFQRHFHVHGMAKLNIFKERVQ
jgi:hypothetical protein